MLRAGQVLGDNRLLDAANEAGRGALALQTRKGQIRERGVMGAFGGALDEAVDVPDRRPTRLTLALVLSLLDAAEDAGVDADPRLRGPAMLAAHWIAGQQARSGAWPSIYPPDAAKGQGARLLMLCDPDLRDTVLSLRLAADVLDDRPFRGRLTRLVDHLGDIRVWAGRPQKRVLWAGAYKLDGDPNPRPRRPAVGGHRLAGHPPRRRDAPRGTAGWRQSD